MIAAYCRVSTQKQNLARQVRSVIPYIERWFDVDIQQVIDTLAEHVADPDTGDAPLELAGEQVLLAWDRRTGTNTDRSGYQRVMDGVENGDIDAVVTDTVSRMNRSLRDLVRAVETIVEENNGELHIIKENFQFTPDEEKDKFQKALFQLLGVFAELEAGLARERARDGLQARIESDEDYAHGPAPLGFNKDNGTLRPAPEYDHVCSILQMVEDDELSKRKAARELDTSRKTINRCLNDRPELYGIETGD